MAQQIRIALIGAGFIGRSHALALTAVNRVFGRDAVEAIPEVLVDLDLALAEKESASFGFKRFTDDWRTAVLESDAVIIAVPSFVHKEIALFAAQHGKHILCEKPVGLSSMEADEIAEAAAQAGVSSAVGFTYLRAPLVRHAKVLLDRGALGRPLHFRGHHNEDYLADRGAPFSWRLDADKAGRCGALGDLGWHILSIARCFCGEVTGLFGRTRTFYEERPIAPGSKEKRTVENEDWATMTVEFASGAVGTIETSRIAHGRKMDIAFELVCERGTLAFHGERYNELELYVDGENAGEAGFRRILANAAHPDYGRFIPAPAHGNSFNDFKTIELREFLVAISENRNAAPDLKDAVRMARICEAVIRSSETSDWVFDPEQGVEVAREGLDK